MLDGGLAEVNPADELGEPPAGWDAACRAIWHEVVASAPPRTLRKQDRLLVEVICRLVGEMRDGNSLKAAVASQLRACLNEFGATPAARIRLGIPNVPEGPNPFAENRIGPRPPRD